MTMQVGLVGTDGIVLASDTKWMMTGHVRQTINTSKLRFNKTHTVAIACARCMEKSVRVADDVIAKLISADEWRYPIIPVEKIAEAVMEAQDAPENPRDEAECLILSTLLVLQLHFLAVGVVNQRPRTAYCRRIKDKIVAGDRWNAGIFWTERYYEPLQIRDLLPLAAQVIYSATKLNPMAIDGLEMVVGDSEGIRSVSEEQTAALQVRAKELDESLARSLKQAGP